MKNIDFLVHTEYSLLSSTIKVEDLVDYAVKNKMKYIAISDFNTMAGVGKFIRLCEKNNIKPIIGMHTEVDDYELVLIAKNFLGYQELSRIASLLKTEKIKFNNISTIDLIIIDHPKNGYYKKYKKNLKPVDYYIPFELDKTVPHSIYCDEINSLNKGDKIILDIFAHIKASKKINQKIPNNKLDPTIIKRSYEIVKDINIKLPKNPQWLPKFKNEKNISSIKYLENILSVKLNELLPHVNNKDVYIERLKHEFEIIKKLGFEDYFLIIADLINWAKKQKILIGPGRGSAAGSLVSFLLNITEIDPIKFNLLFERFLNPSRVTMPDIDIDIQDNKRDQVMKYLFDKYPNGNVALISTYQRIQAKMAIRDIGRYLDTPQWTIDELAKAIPNNMDLQTAYKESTRFKAKVDKTELNTKIYNLALKIEGFIRQQGTHAAGLVISSGKIYKKVPTLINVDNILQTQYTMTEIEKFGLLKIDLLGLKNLQVIEIIQKEIFKNYKKTVKLSIIPLNDKGTLELLSKGETNGIFQLESYGMKKTLSQIGINSFDNLVAIISLYRPGPMEFIPLYAKRKNEGLKYQGISEAYDKIVNETFGIIIYQEQIMEIAQKISSMPLADADLLRYAISKKKLDMITGLKEQFFQGAIKKGYSEKEVTNIFSSIEKFASYGFNKSHAVSYATLAYWLAYLKNKFPFEFYTAAIIVSKGSKDAIKKYIEEIKTNNIKLITPEINISKEEAYNFKKTIILPFSIIKGVGDVLANKIIKEREDNGLYTNFFKAIARLTLLGIGQSNLETLIKVNIFRTFGNANTLLNSLPIALRYASMITQTVDGKKVNDFNLLPLPKLAVSERNINDEIKSELLYFGFNLYAFKTSEHELKEKIIHIQENESKTIVAQIAGIKEVMDRNNNTMGIVTLMDSTKTIEVFVFYNIWKNISEGKVGQIIEVKINKKSYNGKESYTLIEKWKVINEK